MKFGNKSGIKSNATVSRFVKCNNKKSADMNFVDLSTTITRFGLLHNLTLGLKHFTY